jgi:hypothetical protein
MTRVQHAVPIGACRMLCFRRGEFIRRCRFHCSGNTHDICCSACIFVSLGISCSNSTDDCPIDRCDPSTSDGDCPSGGRICSGNILIGSTGPRGNSKLSSDDCRPCVRNCRYRCQKCLGHSSARIYFFSDGGKWSGKRYKPTSSADFDAEGILKSADRSGCRC